MVYYKARFYFTPKISIKSFLIHNINILSNLPCSLPHQNTPVVVTPLNFIPHIWFTNSSTHWTESHFVTFMKELHACHVKSRTNINTCGFIFIISEMITFFAFSYCDGIITNKFTITPSITVIFEQTECVTMTEISERFLWQSYQKPFPAIYW